MTLRVVPEEGLVATMIRQALEDLLTQHATEREYLSAERWLAEASARPWSFEWCCVQLNLDPDAVRRAVRERPDEIRARLPRFQRAYRVVVEREWGG